MPSATDFQALKLQPGSAFQAGTNGLPTIPGTASEEEFRLEVPLATALETVWNIYEWKLSMGYTHAIKLGFSGTTNTYVTSKTATMIPRPGEAPTDRFVSAMPSFSVGGSGTIDTEYYTRNGAWSPGSFGSTYSSSSAFQVYAGSSASTAIIEFRLEVWNRYSLALPTIRGWLVNAAAGATIASSGHGGNPATWFKTHNVNISVFGTNYSAVFVSSWGDPAGSPSATLSGWSFAITRTDYSYQPPRKNNSHPPAGPASPQRSGGGLTPLPRQ